MIYKQQQQQQGKKNKSFSIGFTIGTSHCLNVLMKTIFSIADKLQTYIGMSTSQYRNDLMNCVKCSYIFHKIDAIDAFEEYRRSLSTCT